MSLARTVPAAAVVALSCPELRVAGVTETPATR